MQSQSTAIVQSLYDAFARGDLPGALGCMADDIEWHESVGLPWGGLQHGPDAVAGNVFAPSIDLIPDLAVTPEQIVAAGDTVAVVHRYTGTGSTGEKLDLLGAGVWEVRDGKIARYRQFVDTVKFREVIPNEAAAPV